MTTYDRLNHCKYHLRYHIIFACKYRRRILDDIGDPVKNRLIADSNKIGVEILTIEADGDHIHLLVSTSPEMSPLKIVKSLKQSSGYYVRRNFNLRQYKCRNKLWSAGSFICSIGDASEETIRRYIDLQG